MTPLVTISIVHWNSFNLLREALSSIQNKILGVSYQIIVVDNASHTDLRNGIECDFPKVEFIWNRTNIGFSAANNQAFLNSKSPYLLLLNADTVQVEDSITKAVDFLEKNLNIGGLGVKHLNQDETFSEQQSCHYFPQLADDLKGCLGLSVETRTYPKSYEGKVDWLCGSFLLIRRECWISVGSLDEKLFLYDEDIDWCKRAKAKDWEMYFMPQAKIIHLGSGSGRMMTDKTYSNLRSRLYYYNKHSFFGASILFYLLVIGKIIIGIFKITISSFGSKSYLKDLRLRIDRLSAFVLLKPGSWGV